LTRGMRPDAGIMTSSEVSRPAVDAEESGRSAGARFFGRSALITALRIGALAAFLAIWETASRTGMVDALFASSPSLIVAKLAEMIGDGSIWPHVAATASVTAAGFGLAVLVGVPVGILMGRSELINATAEPFVAALYASPQVAFLPLLIIWLGIGFTSKVALVFIGSVIIMIINTETGVAQVDPRLIETARSFTASERQVLTKIVLPAALPIILAGMRLAIGRALVMVVVAEIYASNRGLGYLIFQAGGMYDTAQVFVGVGVLAAAGVTLTALLRTVERWLAPWQSDARQSG
jgi:ABC-type nitrate/sulfonate/bicarbonate transport system permease component